MCWASRASRGPIFASTREALLAQPCDVFVEFTRPESAKVNILTALEHGVHVVVGTSGLTDEDYAENPWPCSESAARRPRLRQLRADRRLAAEVC